jgi:hypothetical protein
LYELIYPLGPDRCKSDGCAPCAYWHTKVQALNGGRDKLSAEELEFVGVGSGVRTPDTGGWRQPGEFSILSPIELDADLPERDVELLQSLISVGTSQERLEFLG